MIFRLKKPVAAFVKMRAIEPVNVIPCIFTMPLRFLGWNGFFFIHPQRT